ncbi:MAG: hypothetical protein H6Q57_2266 [Geobacteraceae bacterium]|nr:hypothetical protein [Geobacteraceae bacterium]
MSILPPPDKTVFGGIDVGGTNLRFGLIDSYNNLVYRENQPTVPLLGKQSFIERLSAGIERLKIQASLLSKDIFSIGMGIPGVVTSEGLIAYSVKFPYLQGWNPGQFMSAACGIPVRVSNDANSAAYGELQFGAGRAFDSFFMFSIGTGVGGGVILNRKLWTGCCGAAGEFGHTTVEPDGKPCPCGNRGCLEQYVSAGALAEAALGPRESGEGGHHSSRNGSRLALASVADAARSGDIRAVEIFSTAGRYLGIAAASIANLLNVEAIILGGGVTASFDLFIEAMQREMGARAISPAATNLELVKGELGDNAGIMGSAALAAEEAGSPLLVRHYPPGK